MKNWANQTAATTAAIPMSGCFINIATTTRNNAVQIRLPGKPGRSFCSENNQAATTAKVGLTNSEGCNDRPGRLSQRRAPLISTPTTKVKASSANAIAKPITAMRRMVRGGCSETANIRPIAKGSIAR